MWKINIKKLESERKKLGKSKIEFSSYLGLSSSLYGKILQNKSTSIFTLGWIADKLHIKPADLLTK